jgi:hypothetical protein
MDDMRGGDGNGRDKPKTLKGSDDGKVQQIFLII